MVITQNVYLPKYLSISDKIEMDERQESREKSSVDKQYQYTVDFFITMGLNLDEMCSGAY